MSSRSLVAGVNALFRAVETRRGPQAILSDPFAGRFAEHLSVVSALRAVRWVVPPLRRNVDELLTVHCVRHASIDAQVLAAHAEGCRQFVIFGAGYDMRPYRFAALREGTRWFEVDHPETAARKRRILPELELPEAPVERVPTELGLDDPAYRLAEHGFDPAAHTCFILEGLVHYLPAAVWSDLVGWMMSGAADRDVVLSFITPEMAARANGWFKGLVKVLREIPRVYLRPSELEATFAAHGATVEWWGVEDQMRLFARPALERTIGVSQHVARARRRAPARSTRGASHG